MKKAIPYWQTAAFLFTAVMGTLLHFLFDWTGENRVVALFSAVNESIWEHMKLLFYPMLAAAVIEYCIWGKKKSGYWCVKLLGTLLGLAVIPVVYYTYTGILGVNADWFNIAIFFIAAAGAYWTETKLFLRESQCRIGNLPAVAALLLMAAAFTVFTWKPPHIPLFEDPLTGTYGFLRNMDMP